MLACLAHDVEWVLPGAFHLRGKEAFAREIRNENFIGDPAITVTRVFEDGDVVVAEGTVQDAAQGRRVARVSRTATCSSCATGSS